jgi:hypothetical protein
VVSPPIPAPITITLWGLFWGLWFKGVWFISQICNIL